MVNFCGFGLTFSRRFLRPFRRAYFSCAVAAPPSTFLGKGGARGGLAAELLWAAEHDLGASGVISQFSS
jgi:hypothetical protein